MISNDVREQVRARADIAEIVGQYVPLRRAGRSLKACCPFHQEKTPSFHVSPDRGMFYCFGCKASGDVFTFYERIEGVTFPEALRALATRYGITIVEEVRDPARVAEERRVKEVTERLRHACEVAAAFFESALRRKDPGAIAARAELERRGIDGDVAAKFRLGYAPAAWGELADHFRRENISPADGELAGLLLAGKRDGFYDRFRHRLMFPVWDRDGHVVAFSGRVLAVQPGMPEGIVPEDAGKYINSPETPIYRKSDLLFGLPVARAAMRQSAEAILVEGNFDVVAMHQHGFANTVAPLGTAFTETQARLLRRFAERVYILFDADEAGRKAVRASHVACARAGLSARVVTLPNAKDPDELLRTAGGRDRLTTAIHNAPAIVDWMISDVTARARDATPDKIAALRDLAPMIAEVPDELERDVYIGETARRLVLTAAQVQKAVRDAARDARRPTENPFPARPELVPRASDASHFARSARRDGAGSNVAGASGTAVGAGPSGVSPGAAGEGVSSRRADVVSVATARAIDAVLRCPALLGSESADELLGLLENDFARAVVEKAQGQWRSRGELDGPSLLDLAPSDKARAWVGERIMPADENSAGETTGEFERALSDSIQRLRTHRDQEQARQLKIAHARARSEGDEERALELLRRASLIEQRLAANQNRGTE